jgi:hypothetical protein
MRETGKPTFVVSDYYWRDRLRARGSARSRGSRCSEAAVVVVGVLEERSQYPDLQLHVVHAGSNELTCQRRVSSVAKDG